MTNISEIIFRLKNLQVGESVTYYVGCLASQRAEVGNAHTASTAWELSERGKVHLVQRRMGPPKTYLGQIDWHLGSGPGFEYIAIGKSAPKRAPTFNAHLRSVLEDV